MTPTTDRLALLLSFALCGLPTLAGCEGGILGSGQESPATSCRSLSADDYTCDFTGSSTTPTATADTGDTGGGR